MIIPKWLGFPLWKVGLNVVKVMDDIDFHQWYLSANGAELDYTPKTWHYEILKKGIRNL